MRVVFVVLHTVAQSIETRTLQSGSVNVYFACSLGIPLRVAILIQTYRLVPLREIMMIKC